MSAQPTTSISFQNFFSATLTADITSSATDIFLDTVPNGSEGFLVIDPDSTSAREVIYYNSKTATKVVCPSAADGRGQDDTTAGAHLQGTVVIMAPVAAYFETLLSLFTTTPQGYTTLSGTFTSPVYNGNRSYTVTTSVDQTAIVSPGNRFRSTNTVSGPTQCTSLNGTTQYYSKSSPAGITFTDDFVVSAWVKISSYASSTIASRYDGTNGWEFSMESDGRLTIRGFNAASANNSQATSYQSLPLNKWIHVAAQLDMSSFTATTTTSYVMIDGVDVPVAVSRAGTNPTSLQQGTGALQIGARNGALFFPGKIAQVAVFNAKVTQATMRGYISQGLAGTETSLISAYSFNGVITDLNTTSANNLTANGSATATNADSFTGGQANGTISTVYNHFIVQAVTASTLTLLAADGCTLPTVGGISGAAYSSQESPYGCPAFSKVLSTVLWYSSQTTTATATGTVLPGSTVTLTLRPDKSYVARYFVGQLTTGSGQAVIDIYNGSTQLQRGITPSTVGSSIHVVTMPLKLSGSQTFSVNFWATGAGTTTAAAGAGQAGVFTIEEV
jgi:hypothetical protein